MCPSPAHGAAFLRLVPTVWAALGLRAVGTAGVRGADDRGTVALARDQVPLRMRSLRPRCHALGLAGRSGCHRLPPPALAGSCLTHLPDPASPELGRKMADSVGTRGLADRGGRPQGPRRPSTSTLHPVPGFSPKPGAQGGESGSFSSSVGGRAGGDGPGADTAGAGSAPGEKLGVGGSLQGTSCLGRGRAEVGEAPRPSQAEAGRLAHPLGAVQAQPSLAAALAGSRRHRWGLRGAALCSAPWPGRRQGTWLPALPWLPGWLHCAPEQPAAGGPHSLWCLSGPGKATPRNHSTPTMVSSPKGLGGPVCVHPGDGAPGSVREGGPGGGEPSPASGRRRRGADGSRPAWTGECLFLHPRFLLLFLFQGGAGAAPWGLGVLCRAGGGWAAPPPRACRA